MHTIHLFVAPAHDPNLKNTRTMQSRRAGGQEVPQCGAITFTLSFFCAICFIGRETHMHVYFISHQTPSPYSSLSSTQPFLDSLLVL